MSTANAAKSAKARARERGFTFVEIAISLVIVSLMALVVERTLASTREAEQMLDAVRRSTERGQNLAYEIREAVSASRKLFGNDVNGNAYLDALDLTRDPLDPNARLPTFDEVNGLGPDGSMDPRTGNMLLFVREADAAPAVADPATGKIRHIDTYRFICIYPRVTSRFIVQIEPREVAKDLVVWRSVAYPSQSQILAVSNATERANVVKDLYDRFGYDMAWDPNGAVPDAFYAMDTLGNIAATPVADPTIDEDQNLSDRGRLVYANVQLGPTDGSVYHKRKIFTVDAWDPDGFEVKIVGASGSRKVWMHLVVEVQASAGRVTQHTSTVIASTKDL